ncbi:MAG: hypothetical protein ACK4YO_02725, partial [Candidatus Altarchaeaceae archaeon]
LINMKFYGGIKTLNDAKEIEDYIVAYKFYMYEFDEESIEILKNLNKKISFHAELKKDDNSKRNEILALKEIEKIQKNLNEKHFICKGFKQNRNYGNFRSCKKFKEK